MNQFLACLSASNSVLGDVSDRVVWVFSWPQLDEITLPALRLRIQASAGGSRNYINESMRARSPDDIE